MARITQISPEAATGRAKDLLDAVKQKLGLVPNMTRAMANSPAVLDGYLQLSGALGQGHPAGQGTRADRPRGRPGE